MRDKIIIPKNASIEKRTEIFIYKANLVHNNQYDYSKTKYINNRSHVTIICKKHGEFNQVANTHLMKILNEG
ncbi:MAG: hypothetical protein WC123_07975 [Bacilli bacterium]